MTHRPYWEWMQLALEGELPPAHRAELEAHVAECGECAMRWEALDRIDTLFAEAPLLAPRPGFTGRFNARLKQRRAQPRPLLGVFALGFGMLGGALLIFPLGLSVLWTLAQAAGQPATAAAVFDSASAISSVAVTLIGALTAIAKSLGEYALGAPAVWACVLMGLMVVAAWFYLMRRLALQGLLL